MFSFSLGVLLMHRDIIQLNVYQDLNSLVQNIPRFWVLSELRLNRFSILDHKPRYTNI